LSIATMTTLLGALVLPALSEAVCGVDETALPSVLNTWSGGHVATPESASVQVKCTVTFVLYQPLTFGCVVAAALIVGGVWSSLNVLLRTGDSAFPAASWLAA
jgi:hypothetical protein